MIDGPQDKDELAETRPLLEFRPAGGEEIDELRVALRAVVPELAEGYAALHALQPLSDDDDVERAVELAIRIAVILRSAVSDGRDWRSYPPELVWAQAAVLGPGLQSLLLIASGRRNSGPPLTPDEVSGLIRKGYGPAMLA